jgi:aryl-alcohol dehydrogenase-like predicted oxidoreductase
VITNQLNASASGQFTLGGDLTVNRLGFGAMRITGSGIWGEPEDRPEALRTLKRLPELGITFIDTADNKIGFIPWFPLASGRLEAPGSLLDGIAKRHQATPGAVALAWLLKRSPVMLPIPGTSRVQHLEENVAAATVTLSDDEFARLDAEGRRQQSELV